MQQDIKTLEFINLIDRYIYLLIDLMYK